MRVTGPVSAARVGSGLGLEPVPVTGCDICAALAAQREAARAEGRMDNVRTCNREMLSHPRGKADSW